MGVGVLRLVGFIIVIVIVEGVEVVFQLGNYCAKIHACRLFQLVVNFTGLI